ncbi:MAG: AAA family ATPase [Bacteroidota bacterium]
MRLYQIHIIGEYKNLKNFKLDFDGKSFIDVFVGKNGTGKSNLFEALIEIFRHLYEKEHYIPFDYVLQYEIDKNTIEIRFEKGKLLVNGKVTKTVDRKTLPENILIYYSGHNTKISELIKEYEDSFKNEIKDAAIKDTRTFIGIGREYKSLLLAVLLLQPDGNKAKEFIRKKLGISSISDELKITFKRPFYARKNGFDIDTQDEATKFWRPEGITKDFLNNLAGVRPTELKRGRVRDEGYFPRGEEKYADEYLLYLDIKDFQEKFKGLKIEELFRQLDNLKTIEMLQEISIDIKLESGMNASINQFSDGQFQSVYIYSIIEIFKDRNCLTFLDEPDSFLHPEWQFDFLKQVFDIADKASKSNHILMSSHSAVTLVPHTQKHIKLFHFVDNNVRCHEVNKTYAINQMSASLVKYSEEEQILSILNSINIENKPVLFTEGSTDPIILKLAWDKLYKEPIPFIPIMALNCVLLRVLLQDERIFNELGNKPLFGLFDFDEAYNEWNYLKGTRIEKDPYKGLLIDVAEKPSFAFMLPVPKIAEIEKQVIRDKATGETYCHESKMTIEHLFYGDAATHTFFQNEGTPGGGSLIVFKDDSKKKTKFAKEVVKEIDVKHFEVFRPMFEFIKAKC